MGLQYKIFKGRSTLKENSATETASLTVIDIKSRDREGNITEHIRIHSDGKEEVLVSRR